MADSNYSFLPYVRQGLSGLITTQDNYAGGPPLNGERVSIQIEVPVNGNKVSGGTDDLIVPQTINLKGPGDIIGINSEEIIKVSPANWTTNFEPTYLPFVEFYDDDFPWRYTPAKARVDSVPNNEYRLRPWLTLVVLREDEFDNAPFNGILPSFKTKYSPEINFPNEKQTWAWAHVHVNDTLGDNIADPSLGLVKLESILSNNPNEVVSRLLCSRQLSPNTGYYAFVIPTFEVGRLAGIGQPTTGVDGLTPAWQWNSGATGIEYPIYYQWFFKTGAAGDFESLVRLLKPLAVGTSVGKRSIDLQLTGNPVLDTTYPSPVPSIGLQGVLHPTTETPDNWPPAISDPHNFVFELATIINTPATAATSATDPIIAPPIYGKWAAAVSTVTTSTGAITTNWLNNVNLDPRYRVFAGIGAEVVRQNQDKYMDIAWEQVGSVIEANKTIMQMQAAMEASAALHNKHVSSLSDALVLNISSAVHARVKMTGGTVYKNISASPIPNTIFSGAFRRITAPGTTLMQTMSLTGTYTTTEGLITDLNSGAAVYAPAYAAPTGMLPYTIWPAAELTPGYTASLPTLSDFAITVPGSTLPVFHVGSPSPTTSAFVSAVEALHSALSSIGPYPYVVNPALNMSVTATAVRTGTDPHTTVLAYAQGLIETSAAVTNIVAPITALDLILAAPKINIFMYQELAALSLDWLMPGLNDIPDNSIDLLQMDQTYIEAFMLGVNHEMARLLLWRGYPTDQRGTCFSFFWGYNNVLDAANAADTDALDIYKDIVPINQWRLPIGTYPISGTLSPLGKNSPRPVSSTNMLVLTIRGELLRKFPGTIIYMQQAQWQLKASPSGPTDYDYTKSRILSSSAPLYPVFSSYLAPDIYFIGFDIDSATAKGVIGNPDQPGYFIIFQERAGELAFGAEEIITGVNYTSQVQNPIPGSTTLPTWNDLNWGNILTNAPNGFINTDAVITLPPVPVTTPPTPSNNPDNVLWGQNAASMAYILNRQPTKLDVHAYALLP